MSIIEILTQEKFVKQASQDMPDFSDEALEKIWEYYEEEFADDENVVYDPEAFKHDWKEIKVDDEDYESFEKGEFDDRYIAFYLLSYNHVLTLQDGTD